MSDGDDLRRRQRIIALLESYNGEKMTARDICMRLNVDPGSPYEPSEMRVTVISILCRLEEQHKIEAELGDGTFLYWIKPKFRDGVILP